MNWQHQNQVCFLLSRKRLDVIFKSCMFMLILLRGYYFFYIITLSLNITFGSLDFTDTGTIYVFEIITLQDSLFFIYGLC